MGKRIILGEANLRDNEIRGFEVGRRNVLVAKIKGEYKALDDWCNHAGCLLSGGNLEGNMIVCPCHEIGFDLDSGANLTSPGMCDDQRTVKIAVEDGQIVIEEFDPNL